MCSFVYIEDKLGTILPKNELAKRITLMIDDELDKKLRLLQAKEISKTNSSISYSKIINDLLRKQLK